MPKGDKPDFLVKVPREGKFWPIVGSAWNNDGGSVNVVIDVGAEITFQPGAKLVLVENKE